ncbi:MAG: hypothetical protein R3E53_16395 [Myxococcota bacterium]
MVAYGASKAFDMVFAEALWSELRPKGVHVLGLILSETDTPALRRLRHDRGLAGPDEPVASAASAREVVEDALAHLRKGTHATRQQADATGAETALPLAAKHGRPTHDEGGRTDDGKGCTGIGTSGKACVDRLDPRAHGWRRVRRQTVLVPGSPLDPAYPNAEVYLETPSSPSIPAGAACRVAARYVELVNAGRGTPRVAELFGEDATFLEPVRAPAFAARRRSATSTPPDRAIPAGGARRSRSSGTRRSDARACDEDGDRGPITRWLLVSVDHFVLGDDGRIEQMVVFVRPPTEEGPGAARRRGVAPSRHGRAPLTSDADAPAASGSPHNTTPHGPARPSPRPCGSAS